VAKNTYNPEEEANAQRWQYPDVGLDSESKNAGVGILTAEKIESIQNQAYQQAYDEGYAKGFAEGQEKGKQSLEGLLAVINKTAEQIEKPLQQLDDRVLEQMYELVVAITRQLIRREMKTEPGEIVAVVREAISLLPVNENRINISLHPDDVALLKELFQSNNEADHWHFIDDIGLQRGDCKITTEFSTIDASLETRLFSIVNKLWGGDREDDNRAELDNASLNNAKSENAQLDNADLDKPNNRND